MDKPAGFHCAAITFSGRIEKPGRNSGFPPGDFICLAKERAALFPERPRML